ncbi:MAG: translocation/assembly module TamB domain-containing protein [Bacteroidia bacterium]
MWTLLGLALLFAVALTGLYYWLDTDSGKKWLTQKLNKTLTKELGVEVNIGLAELDLPGTVHLHDVLVLDHHQNKLITIKEANAQFAYYNFATGKITLGRVELNHTQFNLIQYKGEPKTNVGLIMHRLQSGPSTGKKTDVLVKYIVINDGNLFYDQQNKPPYAHEGVDWKHIDVKDINGKISFLALNGPDIGLTVQTLNFNEKSGFVLEDLRTSMTYTKHQMEFNNLYIRTPESEIGNYLKLNYNNLLAFDHYIDSVDIEAQLVNAKTSFKDLAYFTYQLQNKTDPFVINSAKVSGKISKLRTTDLDATFGEYSYIKGKVSLRGLPNTNETFIDAKVNEAQTSYEELTKFLPELPVPKEIDKLGGIVLKGNFTGFLNDFVAYGSAKTDLGDIVTDINLKLNKNQALSRYSGNIKTENFNIGKFIEEPLIGYVSMNGKVSGTGFTKETINANVSGNFQRLDIRGYSYHDMTVNGDIKKQFFKGNLTARDPNAMLDFAGTIDFNHAKPVYNFVADIEKANLFALGFTNDTVSISSFVNFDMRGNNIDDFEGDALAYHTKLITPKKTYDFDTFALNSFIDTNYRSITITSDLLNAKLKGNFNITQIDDLLKTTANRYVDSTFLRLDAGKVAGQDIDFDVEFKDMEAVFAVLNSKIVLQDSGYFRGKIDSDNGYVKLEGYLPGATYDKLVFKHVQLDGHTNNNRDLDVTFTTTSFGTLDSTYIRNFKLISSTNNDRVAFTAYAADRYIKKQVELKGTVDIIDKEAHLALDTSMLLIGDTLWQISAKPITIYGDTLVDFPLLTLSNGNQNLKIIGKYSPKTSYPVRVVVEEFGISTIASFIPELKELRGALNGQILVNNINTKKPIVEAALFASPLVFGTDTLGTFTTTTSYNEETRLLTVEAGLENNNLEKTLQTNGTIAFNNKQTLNFDAALNRTKLRIFEPFLSGVFSNLEGTATAGMKITGTMQNPVFKGDILLEDAGLTVTYLNTHYKFNHAATFNGNTIALKNLTLYDERKSAAVLNGKIDLKNINDISLDLDINAQNFQVLNTTQKDNSLYYGEAYSTGYVSINGSLNNLRMYIKMRTDKGTRFYLPISEASTFTGYKFIRFIDKKNFLEEKRDVKITGLKLTLDMEVTPDAVAQIIFDPRVGDLIEGRGEGNIRMDINTDGDFSMYGLYTITQGNYLFTAYDVINKAFDIKPGGTISWRGSPYDANVNIQAAYKVRTTLGPLLNQSAAILDDERLKNLENRTFPVEAQLNLTGALFSPDIKFDFEIQELSAGSSATVESTISSIRSNEQELSKQVVSLLVLNQFAPVQQSLSGDLVGSGLNSSIGDLVSSQINYYLSQIVEDVQVGVDYAPTSQQETQQRDAITLRVSTDLFNDRANVDVGYDVTNNNHNAQVSYKLKADGNTRAKIFSRSNNNPTFRQNSSTIGVGLFFRKEFDKIGELFRKKKTTKTAAN